MIQNAPSRGAFFLVRDASKLSRRALRMGAGRAHELEAHAKGAEENDDCGGVREPRQGGAIRSGWTPFVGGGPTLVCGPSVSSDDGILTRDLRALQLGGQLVTCHLGTKFLKGSNRPISRNIISI